MRWRVVLLLLPALALAPFGARGEVRIGVTISTTGPGASLGTPQRNTVALLPREIGGEAVDWIVLDDGTDSGRAVANARKLTEEDHVDALVGSSVTPGSLAMIGVAAETGTPMIALAASAKIVTPMDAGRRWVFKTPQSDSLMADGIADYMAGHGVKTVGFIGFNDAYGDGWLTEARRALQARGIRLVATERYARNDTSVTGQVLKLMAAHPDAVLIAGAGTPAALPQRALRERGYAGQYYQTHGAANADFLRVSGKDADGVALPSGPIVVAAQLADGNPVKAVGLAYTKAYEAKYGAGSVSAFGAHMEDAAILLEQAIPVAMKAGRPGTAGFRAALRDAIEGEHGVVLTHGIATMSASDHNGLDGRARVMLTVEDGGWKLLP